MDSKKIIETLVKIASNQQKIIHKLAQQQLPPDSLPTSQVGVSGGHPQAPAAPPPATSLAPNKPPAGAKSEGDMIRDALPADAKGSVAAIHVTQGNVAVSFKPGHASQSNYDAVLATVKKLQNTNPPQLPGKNYKVTVA